MKYNIKITYDTADTFNDYPGQEILIELGCDLETATENLKRIEEHYKYQEELSWCDSRGRTKLWGKMKKEKWYSKKSYTVTLLDSEGNDFDQYTDWCGYFERLVCGEVVGVETDKLPSFGR
jgi:hypothetical protein